MRVADTTTLPHGLTDEPGLFTPVARCWVCGGAALSRYHQCRMDFKEYADQDPDLARYSGRLVWLVRCRACGFGQPEEMPTLPLFFDRMYDQRWSTAWVEQEFAATYKDLIFDGILDELARRGPSGRRLLDVGAHAGRFMHLAQTRGWQVEGIELNPRTARHAADRTGAPVHRVNAQTLAREAAQRYDVVVLTDVLEHIPEPTELLSSIARLLTPGGLIAVKVPSGPGQEKKERVLSLLVRAHRMSLADNLVHVNHFSPRSLALALDRAGFHDVALRPGAPELLPEGGSSWRTAASNLLRIALFAAAKVPGALHTPLTLNLQAYARLPRTTR